MSWEGYGIAVCEVGHKTYFNPDYDETLDDTCCPICGCKIIKSVFCDETNGVVPETKEKEKEIEDLANQISKSSKRNIEIHIKDKLEMKEKLTRAYQVNMKRLDKEIEQLLNLKNEFN